MLLSLFAESESQEQEAPAAGEGSDNLDDLFDEDDDGDPYIEPEEEEEDVAPGKSSSAEGDSGLNKSQEDLEGKALGMIICAQVMHVLLCADHECICLPAELKLMQQKMQKLQQQLEASQKTAQPENKPSVKKQTKSLTSPQGVSKTPPPKRRDSDGSPPSDVTVKLKNKQRMAHQPKTGECRSNSFCFQKLKIIK